MHLKYACEATGFAVHFYTSSNLGLFWGFRSRWRFWKAKNAWPRRVVAGQFVVKNDIQQRLVDTNAAVVLDEPEFAKPIHEEADARPCRADHLCQGFL